MTIPVCGRLPENGDSCLPCTPEEEMRIISEFTSKAESNLKDGNLYYVVSNRWYAGWQRYVGDVDVHFTDCSTDNGSQLVKKTFERPGPIDNSDIVLDVNNGGSDEFELNRALQEGHDYVLVPEEAWKKFVDWYKGGPPLPRKLISQGFSIKSFYVEVYPIHLKLLDPRDNSELVIKLSRKSTIHDLYETVCTLKGLEKEKVCIWDYFNKMKIELPPSNQTIEDAHLQMDQDILLEAKDNASAGLGADSAGKELVLVPVEPQSSSLTIAGAPSLSNGQSTQYSSSLYPESPLSSSLNCTNNGYNKFDSRKVEKSGLAGLQNLGNTCFMNSALQCLVHTPPIAAYFLSDYSHEINDRNPLGMQGELAIAFGDLLRTMWSSGQTAAAPRAFKGKVSRFAPQFSGYNQHDSQELLAFLLDGLHEDLNRVKRKPYIETKDSDGRPDKEYADECWRNHKARNDSIIVDTCQGQYKSTLVCPVCKKVSITFDPFMYLTLPLPSTVTRTMTITVFYGDRSSLPKSYKVMVPKHGSCRDLIQVLSKECDLRNDENLLLAEVYKHKIFRYLEVPLEPLSSIKDDDLIVAYVVPKKRVGLKRIEIIHCLERSDNLKIHDGKLLGAPLVTFLGEDTVTVASVEATLKKQLAPFRKSTNDSLSKVQSDKESENHKEIGNDADATDDMMIDEEMINISINGTEEESEKMFSYQLLVADERSSSYKPVELEYVPKAGQCLRVMLDWTKQEYELYDFSFLEDLPAVYKSQFFAKKTRQEAVSLFSCLEAFLKEEPLGPDDMWFCPRCKEHREATKKLDLWRLPEILVIHLKRFSYSRYVKNKLDNFVDFPIHDLDLSKYVNTNDASSISCVYELYAISNHYGGLGGGHYTAYAKLIDDNRWYHFDDSYVSPASEDAIKTSAAYVLFYKRVKGGADTGNSS